MYHLSRILLEFLPYSLTGISYEIVKSGEPMVRQFGGFKIPRKIHQLWKSSNVGIYAKNTSCHAWRQQYETKGWIYKLWTDSDVEDLLTQHYLWLLPQYQHYTYDIQRADFARLLILYHEGGMYIDLDGFPWTTHLDTYPELLMYDVVLTRTNDRNLISNHFLLARQKSSFLAYCLYQSHRTQVPVDDTPEPEYILISFFLISFTYLDPKPHPNLNLCCSLTVPLLKKFTSEGMHLWLFHYLHVFYAGNNIS